VLQHDSAERHHVYLANGVTDDSKGILSDLTVGHDVVPRIDIALVDLTPRNELVDIDGPRAFKLNGLELLGPGICFSCLLEGKRNDAMRR
jgi:hypothetical protein